MIGGIYFAAASVAGMVLGLSIPQFQPLYAVNSNKTTGVLISPE